MSPKLKITVKINNRQYQLNDAIRRFSLINERLKTFLHRATNIIHSGIDAVSTMAVLSPSDAVREFRNYFDNIVSEHIIEKASIMGQPINQTFADDERDANIYSSTSVQNTTITLDEMPTEWNNSIVESNNFVNEFMYTADQHAVDHILCHLQGYTLYDKVASNRLMIREVVRGRDIILTAVMYSVPEIQKGLKNIVLGVFGG